MADQDKELLQLMIKMRNSGKTDEEIQDFVRQYDEALQPPKPNPAMEIMQGDRPTSFDDSANPSLKTRAIRFFNDAVKGMISPTPGQKVIQDLVPFGTGLIENFSGGAGASMAGRGARDIAASGAQMAADNPEIAGAVIGGIGGATRGPLGAVEGTAAGAYAGNKLAQPMQRLANRLRVPENPGEMYGSSKLPGSAPAPRAYPVGSAAREPNAVPFFTEDEMPGQDPMTGASVKVNPLQFARRGLPQAQPPKGLGPAVFEGPQGVNPPAQLPASPVAGELGPAKGIQLGKGSGPGPRLPEASPEVTLRNELSGYGGGGIVPEGMRPSESDLFQQFKEAGTEVDSPVVKAAPTSAEMAPKGLKGGAVRGKIKPTGKAAEDLAAQEPTDAEYEMLSRESGMPVAWLKAQAESIKRGIK